MCSIWLEVEMDVTEKPTAFDEFLNPRTNKTISPERNKHDRMKLLGRKILFYMGIPQNRITEEETVNYKGRTYRVDLIGSPSTGFCSDDFRIAIECGDNKAEKIEALRDSFPLVLILPYREFDMLEESEVKIIKKMLKSYEQQMNYHYFYLAQLRKVEVEFAECKQQIADDIQRYKSDSIIAIDRELESSRRELESIKEAISDYKQELRMLSDFKEFCRRFAIGRTLA